jgi:hypothetical protein|uniref:Uncharacterized protein n=1 Tax=Zea mays TaxID=4577 RepID=A0A804P2P4_MAIZE
MEHILKNETEVVIRAIEVTTTASIVLQDTTYGSNWSVTFSYSESQCPCMGACRNSEEMAEFVVACNDAGVGACVCGGVRTGISRTDQTFTSKAWKSEKFAQASRVKVYTSLSFHTCSPSLSPMSFYPSPQFFQFPDQFPLLPFFLL